MSDPGIDMPAAFPPAGPPHVPLVGGVCTVPVATRGGRRPPRTVEQTLFEEPHRFDFFQAVCLLERLDPGCRPAARRMVCGADLVRFSAHQSTAFPASSIHELHRGTVEHDVPRMVITFLGLTGPSGVLPRHYTETLLRRQLDVRGAERDVLRDWLDLFNDRMAKLFFRAWEKYRFWIAYGRGEHALTDPDAFTTAVFSLAGLGMPSLRRRLRVSVRGEAARPKRALLAEVNDLSLLFYSGVLAQRPRSAVNLRRLLADYFQLPVDVHQFQGQWLRLEADSQSRLGVEGAYSRLASDAVVGRQVWDVAGKFRVRLGPLRYRQFCEFFPDRTPQRRRKAFFLLAHLVRLFVGPELDFDVQLVLQADEVPELCLGRDPETGPRLGWNTWLRGEPFTEDAGDAVLAGEELRWLDDAAACPAG